MIDDMNDKRLRDLVDKYDRPGPRYTSYPTVPEWSDEYGPLDYEQAIRAAANHTEESLSLYLHIPFCRQRCWFCGCNTNVSCNPKSADEYLTRVRRETEMLINRLADRKEVSQFHWGGGTPTTLTDMQTREAYTIFSDQFTIANNAEISVELDPRVTTPERIDLYKKMGFNRLSLGVQDFDANVQAAIGRNQSMEKTVDLYRHCRNTGFSGINFDLIYGLPRQTPETFRQTLARVISLRPDRIALYSFAYLPKLKAHQKKINSDDLPTPEIKLQLFLMARRMFMEEGYLQIGMDHFVLPDDELAVAMQRRKLRRNFMGYTINSAEDWLGIGMSSISYIKNNFAQNISGISSYYQAIDDNRFATYRGLKLSTDDLIRQQVITDLMCNLRVDLGEISSKHDISAPVYFQSELEQLEPFIVDGFVVRDNAIINITDLGHLFVRNIAMTFDTYLAKKSSDKNGGRFSRTV